MYALQSVSMYNPWWNVALTVFSKGIVMERLHAGFFQRVAIGFLALLPIFVLTQVYAIVAAWLDTPARWVVHIPFMNHLFERVWVLHAVQQLLGVVIVFVIVLAVLFLTGTIVMKKAGKRLRYIIETYLLSLLPLYNFLKSIVVRFGGEHGDVPFLSRFERPVFVHVFNTQTFQTGLLTSGSEHAVGGICTVCVPPAPNVLAGAIYNVPTEYVHFLSISTSDAVSAVAAWGVGTDELIARYVAERIERGAADYACILGSRCPLEREVRKAMQRAR